MLNNKENIIEKITNELDECLSSINAEIYSWEDKILDVNLEEKTITIKFNYHVVESDNYVGLAVY